MNSNLSIGLKIKKARENKGISQSRLAQKIGVCRSSVTRWEKGITLPSDENFDDLNNVLNLQFLDEYEKEIDFLHEIEIFKQNMAKANGVNDIKKYTKRLITSLNIDFYLYMQSFRGDINTNPNAFIITDIDASWQQFYKGYSLQTYDPVWYHCWNSVTPVFSDEIFDQVVKSGNQTQINLINNFKSNGYAFYVAIPIHGPCCVSVFSVTVKTEEQKSIVKMATPYLTYAGQILFETVHRVFADHHQINERVYLRPVDKQLIVNLVQGNSVRHISEQFDISESAVRQRIKRLQEKFYVDNRQELCFKVIACGIPIHSISSYTSLDKSYESHSLRSEL